MSVDIENGPAGGADDDAAALRVVAQEPCATDKTAPKVQIFRGWLQDRFFAVGHASGTYAVRGLAAAVVRLEAVDRRAAPGVHQFITGKVLGKGIALLQLGLKLHYSLLYFHLRSIGLEQPLQKFHDKQLGLDDVRLWGTKCLLEVLADLRRSQEAAGGRTDEPQNGRKIRHGLTPFVDDARKSMPDGPENQSGSQS